MRSYIMSNSDKEDKLTNHVIIIENEEIVSRFGTANAEYVKGYKGFDHETGKKFKGLKDISKSKVHPQFSRQNIKQQSGFSAEVEKVSRDNARNIINGDSRRTVRTDDVSSFGTNDTRFDHVELRDGTIIDGSGSQMKFVGNYKKLLNKIALGEGGGKNDLSRYQGSPLDLPSEQVDQAKSYCRKMSCELRDRAKIHEHKGELEKAVKCREQADKFHKLEENCRDSGLTTDEAIFLRKHPELGVALDICKTGHKAGIEGAKGGLAVGAAVSAGLNILSLAKGDIEFEEAVANVTKDACKSAAMGYAGSFVGSVVKGAWQQSDIAIFRSAAKTSIPGMLTSVTIDVAKTLARLGSGEIGIADAVEELGQKGANTVAGVWGGIVGQCAIPVPVVGAVIGSLIGSALSSLSVGAGLNTIREAKEAQKEYERVRAHCRLACRQLEAQRIKLAEAFDKHFAYVEQQCQEGVELIKDANSIEGFEKGINKLADGMNIKLKYKSFYEFKEKLKNCEAKWLP